MSEVDGIGYGVLYSFLLKKTTTKGEISRRTLGEDREEGGGDPALKKWKSGGRSCKFISLSHLREDQIT